MKSLFLIPLLVLLASNVLANTVTINPDVDDLYLTCRYPVEREDGTPLQVGEIAKVVAYVKKEGESDIAYVKVGENTTACEVTVIMIDVPNGNYVYAMRDVDTDGRISALSTEMVTALVKRILPGLAPTEVLGTAVKRQ